MSAPGTLISVVAAAASTTVDTPTGRVFAVGLTQRGPVGAPVELHSLGDFTALFGQRVPYSIMHDWVDATFHEGTSSVSVSRVVGPAAATASVALDDQDGTPAATLTVYAAGPGVDGNLLSVVPTATGVTFTLAVSYDGTVVEITPALSSPAEAVAWSQTSKWVRIVDAGSATAAPSNNPATAASATLTGGADDNANASDQQYQAGLDAITGNYGPGQVCIPGRTTAPAAEALLGHAQATNRVALIDAPNTATAATITTLAMTVQAAVSDPSYGTMLAPWLTCPGLPTGTSAPAYPRTVPPSALVAGLIARSDAVRSVNDAAAGNNGVASYCTDVTATYDDTDRGLLDAAGVSVVRNFGVPNAPQVKLYGWNSLAVDPAWQDLSSVRLREGIVAALQKVADGFEFSQIDGQGHTISAFNGAIVGALAPFWVAGALYGATAGDAFVVNTGPQVNTPTLIAARTLSAQVSLRMSPSAEFVSITITKQPTTVSLAA